VLVFPAIQSKEGLRYKDKVKVVLDIELNTSILLDDGKRRMGRSNARGPIHVIRQSGLRGYCQPEPAQGPEREQEQVPP